MEVNSMITMIKNGEVYAPEPLGKTSILLIDQIIARIGAIDEQAVANIGVDYKVIDAEGAVVVPGFIDPHVHLTGGGGEGGFATRTPEIQLSDIDRKSTRLNSSHVSISYAVFCLKKKIKQKHTQSK